jgi:hypothetical protein
VFAAQTESNFAGYSSEDLVGRVNHKPLMLDVSGFRAESFHELLFSKNGLPGQPTRLAGGVSTSIPRSAFF